MSELKLPSSLELKADLEEIRWKTTRLKSVYMINLWINKLFFYILLPLTAILFFIDAMFFKSQHMGSFDSRIQPVIILLIASGLVIWLASNFYIILAALLRIYCKLIEVPEKKWKIQDFWEKLRRLLSVIVLFFLILTLLIPVISSIYFHFFRYTYLWKEYMFAVLKIIGLFSGIGVYYTIVNTVLSLDFHSLRRVINRFVCGALNLPGIMMYPLLSIFPILIVFTLIDSFFLNCRYFCCENISKCIPVFLLLLSLLIIVNFVYSNFFKLIPGIIVDEFVGPKGDANEISRTVSRLLSEKLAEIRKLFETTDEQRITGRQLTADYPESIPSRFKSGQQINQQSQYSGEVKLGEYSFPVSFFKVFEKYKRYEGRISGTVSDLDGHTIITAEITNGLNLDKERGKKGLPSRKIIWKVSSKCSYYKIASIYGDKTLEEQVDKLSGLIFGSLVFKNRDLREEAITHYINGVRDYKDALNQPFRRGQLLHDAEQHFRKAISEDDHCIEAYYNLGIVYLDLDLPEQAKKFLELALVKNVDKAQIYYALANLMYSPIREKFLPLLRKYWKFWDPDKNPFKYLYDEQLYKDNQTPLSPDSIYQKCIAAKNFCDVILNKNYENNPGDPLITNAYILRSNLNMCIGEEDAFIYDCHKAVICATQCYFEKENDNRKKSLIESLLNLAMALARHVVLDNNKRCDIILKILKTAEEIDSKNSNIYYIKGRTFYYFSNIENPRNTNKILYHFENAKSSYVNAMKLQPGNYNWITNYIAAKLKLLKMKMFDGINLSKDINEIRPYVNELLTCPTKIRHEVLEKIAEIKTEKARNEIDKIINEFRVLVIFAHKLDKGMAACKTSDVFEDYERYERIFESYISYDEKINTNEFTKLAHEKYDLTEECLNSIKEKQKEEYYSPTLLFSPYPKSPIEPSEPLEDEIKGVIDNWCYWFLGQIYAQNGRQHIRDEKFGYAVFCFIYAIDFFEKADKKKEIEFQRLYSFLGLALSHFDCKKSVLGALSKAFSFDSMDPFAHYAKGVVHFKNNDIVEARESFYNALSLSPEPNWRPVYSWYEEKFSVHPWDLYYYYRLTSVRFALVHGRKADRMQALDDSINSFSYLLDVFITIDNKNLIEQEKRRDDQGRKKIDNKKISEVLYWFGRACLLHGEFEKAIEQFELCKIYLNSESVLPDFNSAIASLRLYDFAEAISKLTGIIRYIEGKPKKDGKIIDEKIFEGKYYVDYEELKCHSLMIRACCYAETFLFEKAKKDMNKVWCEFFSSEFYKKSKKDHNEAKTNGKIQKVWARLKAEEVATLGIFYTHKNNVDNALACLSQIAAHTTDSYILYHLIMVLLSEYRRQADENHIAKATMEHIRMIRKIIEEQSLEISPESVYLENNDKCYQKI